MKTKFFCIFFLIVSLQAKSQWTQTSGPKGGNITSLASIGQDLYAGTANGYVFSSSNYGYSWTKMTTGLPTSHYSVKAFARLGSILFTGTSIGIYLYNTNINSWISVNNGLMDTAVTALLVSGTNIFAGTDGGGIFLSTDTGNTWTSVNNGLMNKTIRSLAVNGTILFAGTLDGIFASNNNGSTWFNSTSPCNGLPSNSWVQAIAVGAGNILYAGTYSDGLFKSIDNGCNWVPISYGLPQTGSTVIRINALSIAGTKVFAGTENGVYVTTNGGHMWYAVNNGLSDPYIQVLATNGTNLFAGTGMEGMFLSNNYGSSWVKINNNLINQYVPCFASIGTQLFAGTAIGVFSTIDGGNNWTAKNNGLPFHAIVRSLAVMDTTLFAGTDNGVFKSNDYGNSWTAVNNGLPNLENMYVFVNGTNMYCSTDYCRIYLSVDSGVSWVFKSSLYTSHFDFAKIMGAIGTKIFMYHFSTGLHVSNDSGSTWSSANNGLPYGVNAMAINGSNLFAASGGGVFLSVDSGNSWTAVNNGLTNLYINTIFSNGSNLFVGTGSGVFISNNLGASWASMNIGLTDVRVGTFEVNGSDLFAGTAYDGVFINSTFLSTENELKNISPVSVFPNPTPGHLTVTLPGQLYDVSISIFNTLGQEVYRKVFYNSSRMDFEINGDNGLYFVRIAEGEKIRVFKILKM